MIENYITEDEHGHIVTDHGHGIKGYESAKEEAQEHHLRVIQTFTFDDSELIDDFTRA